jgi:outer membrane lipoprotein SlyB
VLSLSLPVTALENQVKHCSGVIMNHQILRIIAIAATALIGSCASHPDPIIDMKGVNESTMQADWGECEAYSEQVVIGKGAAKGAAGGAVVGAAAGAISGDADGGAGYGAIWGATRSTLEGDREKQMVFKRCMRGRGYKVLN